MVFKVLNKTKSTLVGDRIASAESSAERRTGLLKHRLLEDGAGLWIVPCEAVHTFFMKFAIDVVYLNKDKSVRKAVKAVAPWRFSACLPAYSVLELPVGSIERAAISRGDELVFEQV